MKDEVKIIECPRDAMQGWKTMIPTAQKVAYLNQLLKVGFDVLDFGSFVSPKAIPQMADTREVIPQLNLDGNTKLLAIIANERGATDAAAYDEISFLGYPFSISETFQMRNTNATIEESLHRVEAIQDICVRQHKELVIYISMGFGNPYGDAYNTDIASHWIEKLGAQGIRIFSLADTVGMARAEDVSTVTENIIAQFPKHEIGVHLHTKPGDIYGYVKAAYYAGCRRYDGAINGIGGCPMANDILVGNIDTVPMVYWLQEHNKAGHINFNELETAKMMASQIFI